MKDIVEKIQEDIETNPYLSVQDICNKYNITYYEWKKLGIDFKNKLRPSEKTLEILEKIKAGQSLADLAREYGCSRQAIYDIKKKYLEVK